MQINDGIELLKFYIFVFTVTMPLLLPFNLEFNAWIRDTNIE